MSRDYVPFLPSFSNRDSFIPSLGVIEALLCVSSTECSKACDVVPNSVCFLEAYNLNHMCSQVTVPRDAPGTMGVQREDQDGLLRGGGIWIGP